MGLDMYLFGERQTKDNAEVIERKELGYWRKHPNLHGYIVQTFNKGVDDCEPIYLNGGDMVQIMNAINRDNLPHTTGFFFGSSDWTDHKQSSIDIFDAAIKWLLEADTDAVRYVYYLASW